MTPEQEGIVAAAREAVVRKFRAKEGGYDRPDTPGDPWYKPEEWDDEGNYYGPAKPMLPKPVNKTELTKPELTETDGDELTLEAEKKAKRVAYMREYMKKKREKEE